MKSSSWGRETPWDQRRFVVGLTVLATLVVLIPATDAPPAQAARLSAVYDVPGMRQLSGVWCMPGGSCLGVGSTQTLGGQGAVVVFSAGGPTTAPIPVRGTGHLAAISCSPEGACFAVGQGRQGGVIVQVDADGTPGPVQPVTGASALYGVACPTTPSCVATGNLVTTSSSYPYSETSAVFVAITEGRPAPAQPFTPQTDRQIGIACPTTTTCLSVGGGRVGVLSRTRLGWNARISASGLGTGYVTDGISCTSSKCYATAAGFVPSGGGVVGVPALAAVSVDGAVGPTQNLTNRSGNAYAISCVGAGSCTVVGNDNLTAEGLVVDVTGEDPTSVTFSAASNAFTGISCVTTASCGFVGQRSQNAVVGWKGPAIF